MGLYIEGMEMPISCEECIIDHKFFKWLGCNKHVSRDTIIDGKRSPACPLIEVPEPHGRLIDADALVEDLKRQCEEVFKIDAVSPDDFWITRDQAYNERLWKTWCESFFEYLKTRETVIPASEEG